jgi:hypothetical protein
LDTRSQACIITITNNEIVSVTDTLQAKYTVKILLDKLVFTTYDMPTGTDELYAASVEASAFYEENSGQAIEIVVTNSMEDTEYL